VIEQGGFTAAAHHLCLSQSAVSQAVALLEKTVGAPLVLRGRDGVRATTAGRAVLKEARIALAAIERMIVSASAPSHLSGTLSVGVVQSAAVNLLPKWVRQLRAEHPLVTVRLFEGTDPEVMDWMLAGVIDVGITSRVHPDLSARAVYQDDYLVVMPLGHPLAGRPYLTMAALHGERMLLSGGGCETLIVELLAAAGSAPDVVCLVRDNTTLISMVREGVGLTIMPELALTDDRAGIAVVGLRPALPRTLHCLTREAGGHAPVLQAFVDLVQNG
jgi:DNA-binding transcriptional LysR family regulator